MAHRDCRIRHLYSRGWTLKQIANEFHLSVARVQQITSKYQANPWQPDTWRLIPVEVAFDCTTRTPEGRLQVHFPHHFTSAERDEAVAWAVELDRLGLLP